MWWGHWTKKKIRTHIVNCLCSYKAVRLKSSLPTHRNLICRNMTAPPPALSPSGTCPGRSRSGQASWDLPTGAAGYWRNTKTRLSILRLKKYWTASFDVLTSWYPSTAVAVDLPVCRGSSRICTVPHLRIFHASANEMPCGTWRHTSLFSLFSDSHSPVLCDGL